MTSPFSSSRSAEMVEQEIARFIAQHLVQRLPRQRLLERRVEQLLDPCGVEVLRRAVPCIAHGPDALPRRTRRRRCALAHGYLARDRAALRRRAVARELRVPGAHGGRCDLGEPEIRRPAVPLTRSNGDVSIGRDQRKLAIERLLRGEDDTQRRALPRRDRRGQDREPSSVFAAAGWTLGLCVRICDEKCTGDQQRCRHSSSKLACRKQSSPLAPSMQLKNTAKASG